ncbi:MAG: Uma2 family endonuclease [Oscillospiraceae bacterium]|nr:Uma2 family endonuclease [Oscillospiraceae bacterium]
MEMQNIDKEYTYSDYLNFPEDERWELIDGVPYMMSAPIWEHQFISRELLRQISNQLMESTCEVAAAPFDLRLPYKNEKDKDISTVIQPDILIVCDVSGIKGTGYSGVPDFIIEISSDSTSRIDKTKKLDKFERSGVKEYWIVDPEREEVDVFILNNGIYGKPKYYFRNDKIRLTAVESVEVDLKAVFNSVTKVKSKQIT